MDTLTRLLAIEEIKQLKARYFRSVDTKDWDLLASVFTSDVQFDRTTGSSVRDPWTGSWHPPLPDAPSVCSGRAEVLRMVRQVVESVRTVHHGHTPEIDILSDSEARAVWPMNDVIWTKDHELILRGTGYYFETYEKLPSGWAIKTARLVRLSLEYGVGFGPK